MQSHPLEPLDIQKATPASQDSLDAKKKSTPTLWVWLLIKRWGYTSGSRDTLHQGCFAHSWAASSARDLSSWNTWKWSSWYSLRCLCWSGKRSNEEFCTYLTLRRKLIPRTRIPTGFFWALETLEAFEYVGKCGPFLALILWTRSGMTAKVL